MRPPTASLIIFLLATGIGRANEPNPAGYVIDIAGDWYIQARTQPIKFAQAVHTGDLLEAKDKTPATYITIALLDGSDLISDCRQDKACGHVQIPQQERSAPDWKVRVMRAVGDLFHSQSLPHLVAITRNDNILKEAVLPLARGQLDVTASLPGVAPGEYHVILNSITGKEKGTFTTTMHCDPRNSCSAKVQGLHQGLFELEIEDDGHNGLGSPIVVLVATSREYRKTAARFAEGQQLVSEWQHPVRDTTVHLFLPAVLFSLTSAK